MVRYLCTINFTAQGIRDIEHSAKRADEFHADVEKAGGKILFQYWSIGDADGCFAFEASTEQIATRLLIRLEQHGNVRTKTMRIFNASEFEVIAAKE